MIEIFIVIKDGADQHYLLKVIRNGFDVYCIPPALGIHYSLHESGESHFKSESIARKPRENLPIIMISGEAGNLHGKGIIRETLKSLGHASCIYNTIYWINSLSEDYQKFNRSAVESFVINKDSFPEDTECIEIGIWAVPERNKVSFEFNNPDIPANLLYKVAHCEPQIWIYARPF